MSRPIDSMARMNKAKAMKRAAIRESRCADAPIGCGEIVTPAQFRDDASRDEYRITALCQQCQDRVLGTKLANQIRETITRSIPMRIEIEVDLTGQDEDTIISVTDWMKFLKNCAEKMSDDGAPMKATCQGF